MRGGGSEGKGAGQKQQGWVAHSNLSPHPNHKSTGPCVNKALGEVQQCDWSTKERRHTSEAGGSRVPEAAGTRVPEAAGTRVPEAAGTRVQETASTMVAGTMVPEAAGTMVLETTCSRVPETAGTRVPEARIADEATKPTPPGKARSVESKKPSGTHKLSEQIHPNGHVSTSSSPQPPSPKVRNVYTVIM